MTHFFHQRLSCFVDRYARWTATLASTIFFITTVAHGQTNKTIPTAKSKNWISVSYLKCLENELPCECQQKEKHSLIRLDSNYATIYDGIIYDPNGGYLKKTANNSYQVYFTKYITNLFKDSAIVIGTIQVIGDTLYYTDSETKAKTSFVNYGSANDHQWVYYKEHIRLLDIALVKRGYPTLEKILNNDSIRCNCNPELGLINLISADGKGWILQIEDESLFIYKWTNIPNEKPSNIKIEKQLLKSFAW